MTAIAAAGRRFLPRGWADFGLQLGIWFGFLAIYEVARGLAGHNEAAAFSNGLRVIDIESKLNALYELTFQRLVNSSHFLGNIVSLTYWNSEFTVVGLTLLFVYLRRNGAFVRFRNTILLANILGLIGYIALPTAPPRMFPSFGFADEHRDGFVSLAANPYAAMPSLHAADALIVGIVMASVCRRRIFKALWLFWPAWVWFCVMASANHYWLDVLAGIVLAAVSLAIVYRREVGRAVARVAA